MATYTRTIDRISSAVPAWRAAIRQTDRLYYVSATPPFHVPALPGMPPRFGSSSTAPDRYGAGWDVIGGYSSGTWLADVGGPFGTMVYGTGGHTRLQNQMLALSLGEDRPSWSWWHPPTWKTSDTGGAELYYSPSEEAALIAGPRGTAARIRNTNETEDAAAWDRQFPLAFMGWIFPRKLTTGQMGDNVPHGFRYSSVQYLPSSVTGGDPLLLALLGPQGPFAQSYAPGAVTETEWFDPSALCIANGKNRRRLPYYFRNCRTGAWTEHKWQPDKIIGNVFGVTRAFYFSDVKRVYVVAPFADFGQSVTGWYYIDFSNGFANHTVSRVTYLNMPWNSYCDTAFSEGDPLGRHFAVALATSPGGSRTGVGVFNVDVGTYTFIDLSAYGFQWLNNYEKVGVSYDAVNKRVLYVTQSQVDSQLEYWSIAVPDTLSNLSGWTAVKRRLSLDDPAMATTHFANWQNGNELSQFYGKTRYLSRLGVILVPSAQQRMLGFVPAN